LNENTLAQDLMIFLIETINNTPPPLRKMSHWIMNTEWYLECRRLTDATGSLVWIPPVVVQGEEVLLGFPVEVSDQAGVPALTQRDVQRPGS
jgi:HK97 family phage major capsid protein